MPRVMHVGQNLAELLDHSGPSTTSTAPPHLQQEAGNGVPRLAGDEVAACRLKGRGAGGAELRHEDVVQAAVRQLTQGGAEGEGREGMGEGPR